MEQEIWKPVDGFEDLYEVSNLGRVKSLNYHLTGKERIIKPFKNKKGYLRVNLFRNGKQKKFLVHRLVATAFIPNPNNLPQVNHRDEVKTNNFVENLEFCDAKYNANYGTHNVRSAASRSKPVEASRFSDFRTIEFRFASTMEAGRNGYRNQCVAACCRGCYSANRRNFFKNLYWRYTN